jgi:hypothetical protein
MLKVLLIFNDPPDGTERSYNGLRLGDERSANSLITSSSQ